jgi:hypothetical protein
LSRLAPQLAVITALFSLALVATGAATAPWHDEAPATKPAAIDLPDMVKLHVKFTQGSGVRLRGGQLTSVSGRDLSPVAEMFRSFRGISVRRMFTQDEAGLDADVRRLNAATPRGVPDLNLWYVLDVPASSDVGAIVDGLSKLPIVQHVYVEPPPAPAPATPDFEPQQGYLNAAPDGLDARYAWALPGGTGAGVKIIDVEYAWNQNHEDLSKAVGALIPNGTPCDPFSDNNHGTAVLGEMVANRNGFGVTGIAYGASLGLVNAANGSPCGWDLANAINLARVSLNPGDVMLIEQQTAGGPFGGCDATSQLGCAPVEWIQSYFDAIQLATASGIIVVEPAANGGTNLDDPAYSGLFNRGVRDSGAIMVGAGSAPGCTPPAHARLSAANWGSNYGSRVDVQGWGECVTTTGYGYLYGTAVPNQRYTAWFGGTSSASPMIAGAAADLIGASRIISGRTLSPLEVRNLLTTSLATPQSGTGNIGPLPNLDLLSLVGPCPPVSPPVCAAGVGGVAELPSLAALPSPKSGGEMGGYGLDVLAGVETLAIALTVGWQIRRRVL